MEYWSIESDKTADEAKADDVAMIREKQQDSPEFKFEKHYMTTYPESIWE